MEAMRQLGDPVVYQVLSGNPTGTYQGLLRTMLCKGMEDSVFSKKFAEKILMKFPKRL